MDAVPASIRKMQAAATELRIDDISTKDPIFNDHAKAKRAADGGPLPRINKPLLLRRRA